jgi:hypothetical protein
MVWISRLIAALLVSVITIAVLTQIFDATLLNSKFLTNTANKSGVYSLLSEDISNQLVKNFDSQSSNNNITSEQASKIIHSVLTSSLLQEKINGALSQIQAYYKGNGPTPTISLKDVISKLQLAGLPISNDNSTLNKPIVINGNEKVKQQVNNFEKVKLFSSILAIFLLVILLLLSWEEHRWKVLPDLSIIVGILLGIISLIFIFGVRVADKYAKINFSSNDFENTANVYAKSLTHNIGEMIGTVSVILLVVGIATRVLLNYIVKPSSQIKSSKNIKSTATSKVKNP